MLPDEINFSIEDFKKVFEKKFSNFCKKAPILMSYMLMDDRVSIYQYDDDSQSKRLFDFPFDFEVTIKENIRHIKEILLEKYYPIMTQEIITTEKYSPEELNQLISKGKVSLDEATDIRKTNIKIISWRIEKVIVLRDELFIRNMNTNKLYRYRLRSVPVTIFLKKVRLNLTSKEAWDLFQKKSQLLNELQETNFPE